MICYKLKHIPSGLYFCPVRKIKKMILTVDGCYKDIYIKSNLSKKGKIYMSKLSLKRIGYIDKIYSHLIDFSGYSNFDFYSNKNLIDIIDTDWEIEEI